jgi:hypothetical protein
MEVHQAERLPVDLLLLLDVSSSMEARIPGDIRRKGDLIREALISFVKDPRSAGLGLGLRLFPAPLPASPPAPPPPAAGSSCQSDAECGPHTVCRHQDRFCVVSVPGQSEPDHVSCRADFTGGPPTCPFGGTCVPATHCTLSKGLCFTQGQPCPSGMPGDVCEIPPRQCLPVLGGPACETSSYEKPALPIGELPGAEPSLVQALQGLTYTVGTPMGPALAAALAHARAQQAANPTHRVALVLATDGMPFGCEPGDAAGISALVAAEAMRSPPISTYAIGVFDREDLLYGGPALLESVATAGGTGMPLVLNNDPDLARSFLDALEKIRQASLPCEFVIPRPNGPIDFGKVNLRVQDAAGTAEEIPYVATANRCDPVLGGWYYDVDPASATPTRVLTCPVSCDRLQAGPDANVSLVFGCKTRVID